MFGGSDRASWYEQWSILLLAPRPVRKFPVQVVGSVHPNDNDQESK